MTPHPPRQAADRGCRPGSCRRPRIDRTERLARIIELELASEARRLFAHERDELDRLRDVEHRWRTRIAVRARRYRREAIRLEYLLSR